MKSSSSRESGVPAATIRAACGIGVMSRRGRRSGAPRSPRAVLVGMLREADLNRAVPTRTEQPEGVLQVPALHPYDIRLRHTWLQTTLPLPPHQRSSRDAFPVVRSDEREAHRTREICLV
jgi:hypothetical protein